RVVEEAQEAIAGEEADGRLEALDEPPDGLVELPKDTRHLLGLRLLGKGREPVQRADEYGHLDPVALQDRLVVRGREDELGDRGRQEAPKPPEPRKLLHLAANPRLQVRVELCEL